MKRLRTAFSAVLLSVATGSALGAGELPVASSLPKNVVQISPVIPGMGEHWADPKDLPLGPIYGVSEGRVIFLEFMIDRATLAKGKTLHRTCLQGRDQVSVRRSHGHRLGAEGTSRL
ncbi:hypothetical protein [Cupriavidus sp. TMH.W2]|uniref:hypothetical protein n=1 Tax=Cupriavidus sp. TMH.W2 TaxID=3434465 RepID=UPI003D774657